MRFLVLLVFLLVSFVSTAQIDTLNVVEDTIITENATPLDSTKSERIDQLIGSAKKYLGIPYRYSGTSPAGFDCSGFIYYMLKKYDINITRSSASMSTYGKRVKLADVRKGDLLFFSGSKISKTVVGHVGMVIENENGVIKFIHSANNGGVQITTFNGSKYYVPRFISAKRLEY